MRAVLTALAAFALAGCDTLGYYRQAIVGQVQLLTQRREIDAVLQQASLPDYTRKQLQLVKELRLFAANELKLPVKQRYNSYVDLGRDFVVWNVFAAPELSMDAQQWCYPVAGCVSYRGYFAENAAQQFADSLKQQGLDVYVGGVAAYSTLGWFDDPVLSSMLKRDDAQLAATLFHELAHQLLYVKGDTVFNESFATMVEMEGQRRWLQQHYAAVEQQAVAASVQTARERQQQFVELVQQSATQLRELYNQSLPDAAKRERKQQIQQQLRERYVQLKSRWQGYNGYDRWFAGPLNNAQLGTVTTYNTWVGAFDNLLKAQQGDLAGFYADAKALAALSPELREQKLRELSARN